MRIALVNLTGGGLSGGYLKYLKRLVPHLADDPGVSALSVFAPEAAAGRLQRVPWPLRTWPADDARRGFAQLKEAVRAERPDVVFIPTAGWIDFGAAPVVVMVRNMEPLEAPWAGNAPGEAARNLARRFMAKRACRRAARIIAVSRHVRDYLTTRWAVEAAKIGVVYHGADQPETAPPPVRPARLAADVARGFLFAAGSIRPARGLSDLVDALPRTTASGRPAHAVVAGEADASAGAYRERMARRARVLGVADRLHWTGGLSEAEMRWCYEACGAFVMTSRAEACPNVALEAMSYGCASVAVEHAPMPEFLGSSALYYRAGDSGALARAATSVLSAAIDVDALRAAALARASAFDWPTTARQTVAELQTAVRS